MIETLRKRGYRFNSEIALSKPQPVAASSKTGGRRTSVFTVAIIATFALFVIVSAG